MKAWYLSCPHGCSDPETCPYGRNHLQKIRALIQKEREAREEIESLKRNRPVGVHGIIE